MAARINKIRHDEETRSRIRASQLINRLHDHVDGKVELSPSQVRSAEILLKKVLPDLASVEHSGEVQQSYIARMPAPVENMEEWQKRYTPKPH